MADILDIDVKRVSDLVVLWKQQGRFLPGKGMVVNLNPPQFEEDQPEGDSGDLPYARFEQVYYSERPDELRMRRQLETQVAPLQKALSSLKKLPLVAYRKAAKAQPAEPDRQPSAVPVAAQHRFDFEIGAPEDEVPDVPDDSLDSPDNDSGTSREPLRDVSEVYSETPRKNGAPINKEVNSKQQQQQAKPPEAPETDVVVVAEKLSIEPKAAERFLQECRRVCAAVTVEDVLWTIEQVRGTIGSHIRNPVAIILKAVPPKLAEAVARREQFQPVAEEDPMAYSEGRRESAELFLATDSPLVTEEDKAWAREFLALHSKTAGAS